MISRAVRVFTNSSGSTCNRDAKRSGMSLSDVTNKLRGEPELMLLEIVNENIAEARPEPYEKNSTRLPAKSSIGSL